MRNHICPPWLIDPFRSRSDVLFSKASHIFLTLYLCDHLNYRTDSACNPRMVPIRMLYDIMDVALRLLDDLVEPCELLWEEHGIASSIFLTPTNIESIEVLIADIHSVIKLLKVTSSETDALVTINGLHAIRTIHPAVKEKNTR
ncbi:hypothetical protein AbraIFM66950_001576 [Aspergillus brasiliensis]|nr:hypothetical protein AbraIFM66950_001576 [Aspergillus brasiliensis]